MSVSDAMRGALDGLYDVFAQYEKPLQTNPCRCCHTEEDESKLLSKQLRELGIDELGSYMYDALLTWGGESEFKHFLPRIFELYLAEIEVQRAFIDPEIVFSRFRHARWLEWSAREQQAVRHLLHVLWIEVINRSPQPNEFDEVQTWLCTIAQAEDDLLPYLDKMLEKGTAVSLSLSSLILGTSKNAFWNQREAQYIQFQIWTATPLVGLRLKEARDQASDEEQQAELHAAYLMATSTD